METEEAAGIAFMGQLFESGTFFTGCNYWASHAGTSMWHDWSEKVVSKDLKTCASKGMKVLRVFPLWSDFQPVERMFGCGGEKMELRIRESPLPDTEEGSAGIDPVMMDRFEFFCREAEKNKLSLIVGIITGWMSGRLFVPPALEGVDILTDPEAIRLQVKFVRFFVKRMKRRKSILAWDLGNECNCLQSNGKVTSASAWLWMNSIVSAIRLEDETRPVVSGMHGLRVDEQSHWSIRNNAELTDILTTHPYPLFTPFCNLSEFNELPSPLHSTAESLLYADIGGKPCFVEEAGSLGPMQCSGERAAANMWTSLFSAWAHDLRGYVWWCGFDQNHLKHPPYDWIGMERELGLFTADHQPKHTAETMKKFTEYLGSLPFEKLPPRKTDAVCVLTYDQNHWKTAFSSFYLAKQAGLEFKFASASAPLPDSDFYIMPAISGFRVIDKHRYDVLLEKVKKGASLFVTCIDGVLQPFGDVFGCRIDYRTKKPSRTCFRLEGESFEMTCDSPITQKLIAEKGKILAKDSEGAPVLVQSSFGKGKVFFLSVPIEDSALESRNDFWKIYRKVFELSCGKISFPDKPPSVGITEHFDGKNTICILINYSSVPVKFKLGRSVSGCFPDFCKNGVISLPGNDGAAVIFSGPLSAGKKIRNP